MPAYARSRTDSKRIPGNIMLYVLPAVFIAALVALLVWRCLDHWADQSEMRRLRAIQPRSPLDYSSAMIAGLPEPAQRYFNFTITEGASLFTVAEIEMAGRFGLGGKMAPNYLDMHATQVLAAPEGFIWKMRCGSRLTRMSGSDSASWTRFWFAGIIPVARLGGNCDHARSAFGRYIAEAVFWTPAALLPGAGVAWEAVGENAARVTVTHRNVSQSVEVTVAEDGRPTHVVFPRWSNANPEKSYRIQSFGGFLSEFRDFDGFRLPTHIEAGNEFGTDHYFPFFIVDVTGLKFPR